MYKLKPSHNRFYLPDTDKMFVTNFEDKYLELYQQAIVGVGGQIERNRPGFPYYNELYTWSLFLPEDKCVEFFDQLEWMETQKNNNVEYWWIK
jgi:hypothetical protein